MKFGTEAQRERWLPRLANGQDIPAFGLTSPEAGSDAGSIPDFGIICKGEWEGEEVLGMRLTWNKRYITLAPIATVLGLAFKLLGSTTRATLPRSELRPFLVFLALVHYLLPPRPAADSSAGSSR